MALLIENNKPRASGFWSPERDELLKDAYRSAAKDGYRVYFNSWHRYTSTPASTAIITQLQEKSSSFTDIPFKKLSERFTQHLCPQIITTFTDEIPQEDKDKMISLQRRYKGTRKWTFISEQLCKENKQGKYYPPNTIKNYLNKLKKTTAVSYEKTSFSDHPIFYSKIKEIISEIFPIESLDVVRKINLLITLHLQFLLETRNSVELKDVSLVKNLLSRLVQEINQKKRIFTKEIFSNSVYKKAIARDLHGDPEYQEAALAYEMGTWIEGETKSFALVNFNKATMDKVQLVIAAFFEDTETQEYFALSIGNPTLSACPDFSELNAPILTEEEYPSFF